MSDIKIFVSHRIDMDSETIDNPLYIPVRCGAIFDKRENVTMLGDDTGDNISEKRSSYCELTVQYWAWKNVEADYYGLCHYRRYLSFSQNTFVADKQEIIHEKKMGPLTVDKHQLMDEKRLRGLIKENDAIIATDFDLTQYPFECRDRDVCKYWNELDNILINYKDFEILIETILKQYPDYSDTVNAYIKGKRFLGYNCFILKKDLFFDLCQFEFSILSEVEKQIDDELYGTRIKRTLGYLSETLYSIWIQKNIICGTHKYFVTKIVMFDDTQYHRLCPAFGIKTIPIVVMASKFYAAFSAPFVQSLVDCTNGADEKYEVIYLHNEISDSDQMKLKSICEGAENIEVTFFNPAGLIDVDQYYVAGGNYAKEAYFRIFAPWILTQYNRVLVFDIDIILKKDPAYLFHMPLGDNLVGGVKDVLWQGILNAHPQIFDYCNEELKLKNPYDYINTGVLVLNLESIRKLYTLKTVSTFVLSKKFMYQEQDALNVLFEGKIQFFDVVWNYYIPSSPDIIAGMEAAPYNAYQNYLDKYEECAVMHFAANPKPWFAPEIMNAVEYWSSAKKTPFYEALISRMIDAKASFYVASSHMQPTKNSFFCSFAKMFKAFSAHLFPYKSKRRAFLKKCYFKLRGWKE